MDGTIKGIARTGYVAKGVVYCLIGVLTFLAALDLGGQTAGSTQVLEFLDRQVFGNILLSIIGIGIACYALWRFTQAFSDPEGIGTTSKGKVKRFAFFLSGCSYLILGYLAFMKILGSGNSGQGEQKTSILMSDWGLILLGIAGALIGLRGLYQFYKVFRKDFTKELNLRFRNANKRELIEKTASMGLLARGVLFLIIGYFAVRAALSSNLSQMKNTGEAFSFIESSSFGPLLLALVALGAFGYGIFMFFTARYRHFR